MDQWTSTIARPASAAARAGVELGIHGRLDSVADLWKRFEQGTVTKDFLKV